MMNQAAHALGKSPADKKIWTVCSRILLKVRVSCLLSWTMVLWTAAGANTYSNADTVLRGYLGVYRSMYVLRGPIAASPTGPVIAFETGDPMYETQSKIRLFDLRRYGDGARVIAAGSAPSFSPDGKVVAFFSDQSGSSQLWLYDTLTDRLTQLSDVVGGIQTPVFGIENNPNGYAMRRIVWSPNGRQVAFGQSSIRTEAAHARSVQTWMRKSYAGELAGVRVFEADSFEDPLQFATNSGSRLIRGGRTTSSQIMLLDVKSKGIRRIGEEKDNLFGPIWSVTNASKIYASSRCYSVDGQVATNLVEVDVRSGEIRSITSAQNKTDESIGLSPNGRFLALTRSDSTGLMEARSQLSPYVMDLLTGKEQRIEIDLPLHAAAWIGDDKLGLVFRDQLSSVIVGVDAKNVAIYSSEVRPTRVQSLGWSRDSRTIYLIEDHPTTPLRIAIRDSKGEQIIFEEDDPFGAKTTYHPLEWLDIAGNRIGGMLMVSADAKGRPPVLLDPYPGSARWAYESNATSGTQILLKHGYAVLHVNVRTPHTWFDFDSTTQAGERGKGAGGAATVVEDLDQALIEAGRLGVVDTTRVCGFGHSNGGGALTHYIVRSSLLRCSIIVAPAYADWWRSAHLRPKETAALIGGVFPWENREAYLRLDALGQVDKVKTPTLFAVGMDDLLFPLSTISWFNSLRVAGKSTSLLMYPGQGHNFSGDAEFDFWKRKIEFLNSHLEPKRD